MSACPSASLCASQPAGRDADEAPAVRAESFTPAHTPDRGGAALPPQEGQALVESLVAVLALAVLWVGLNWLAHYQDMALSATHAGRHAAFLATRADPARPVDAAATSEASNAPAGTGQGAAAQALIDRYFTGSAHHWKDRRGDSLLDPAVSVRPSWRRLQPLSADAQPGAAAAHAATLRREWSLEDGGILRAGVALRFPPDQRSATTFDGPLKLGMFDLPYPPLQRSTYILTGTGHAVSDADAQSRVAASRLAWASASDASRAAGGETAGRAGGVDAAWNRPDPRFDWLRPWSGRVPAHLIQDYEGSRDANSFFP